MFIHADRDACFSALSSLASRSTLRPFAGCELTGSSQTPISRDQPSDTFPEAPRYAVMVETY